MLYFRSIYYRYLSIRFSFTRYCFTFSRAVKTASSRLVFLVLMAVEMVLMDSFHLLSCYCRKALRMDCWHFSCDNLFFVYCHLPR